VDIFERLQEDIDGFDQTRDDATSKFYGFEPWDVAEREDWVYQLALDDGVDLRSDEIIKMCGPVPRDFQTGFFMSKKFFRVLMAGSQVGKSICPLMELFIRTTGETPISFRYPRGFDTGIKREVTRENILRWGRHDSVTGTLIDYDPSVPRPEDWSEWDCGTIVGAGIYPKEKIFPPGSQVWIGTFMKAMNNFWWPRFYEQGWMVVPQSFIDRGKGNNGYNVNDRIMYLVRDAKVLIVTYESGYDRFEAERSNMLVLDEEPPNEQIFQSAQQHTSNLCLIETPYRGITFTKKLVFGVASADKDVFHACQYDSPYQENNAVDMMRKNMEPWHRASRIWGVPSEAYGKPYFDRKKISSWLSRFQYPKNYVRFVPSAEYFGILDEDIMGYVRKGLLSVSINAEPMDNDNSQNTWLMFEDVMPDQGYVMTVDPAEGAENPDEAADLCAAQIWRPPLKGKNEKRPVLCASLASTLETIPFARVCLMAARYYNNALLGAETKRGFSNATFAGEARDWPYWYHMVLVHDATGKPKKNKGFDTNAKTRSSIFDLISAWLGDFDETEHPHIPDEGLLHELYAAVRGKNGRCDHTHAGTLDRSVCMGIFLYILANSLEQISCNVERKRKKSFFEKVLFKAPQEKAEKPLYLGENMPKWR